MRLRVPFTTGTIFPLFLCASKCCCFVHHNPRKRRFSNSPPTFFYLSLDLSSHDISLPLFLLPQTTTGPVVPYPQTATNPATIIFLSLQTTTVPVREVKQQGQLCRHHLPLPPENHEPASKM
ncbi:unnamed protein product [Linum trigynum]|uniref:Secreted protein n=1 Tax=Linum trigynum TaxID=586398 RepID=A0AAV2CGB5_9ROSI